MTPKPALQSLVFDRVTPIRPAAIPIRTDRASQPAKVDWLRTSAVTIQTAPVAFARSLWADGELSITATFTFAVPSPSPVFVRAIARSGRLGNVVSTKVDGTTVGPTPSQRFPLEGVHLHDTDVGEHDVHWAWQFSADEHVWHAFGDSVHRVFVTLGDPAPPWGRPGVAHTVVPWLDVIDTACTWAKGCTDAKKATSAIVERVNAFGGIHINSNIVTYYDGASVTGEKKFYMDTFMHLVRREAKAPHGLNCADLNTAVAMFSSAIGCSIRVTRFRSTPPTVGASAAPLQTNPVKLFGHHDAGSSSFEFHEVASLTPGGSHSPVWDACLQIDFDTNPQNAPGTFALPRGLAMDNQSSTLGYRARFLRPTSQNCLIDLPGVDGIRYPEEMPPDDPASPARDPRDEEVRKSLLTLMTDMPDSSRVPQPANLRFAEWLKSVWLTDAFDRRIDSDGQTFVFTPIAPAAPMAPMAGGNAPPAGGGGPLATPDDPRLLRQVLQTETRAQAVDVFIALATNCTTALVQQPIGDFALYGERSDLVFLLRGLVVAEIHAEGPNNGQALAAARALDDLLLHFYPTPA
jgi:hypothetical protein